MASHSDTGSSSPQAGLVTCPTCDYSVPQATGKKRTICPNCGHFYSKEAAEGATSFQRNVGVRGGGAQRPRNGQSRPNERKAEVIIWLLLIIQIGMRH